MPGTVRSEKTNLVEEDCSEADAKLCGNDGQPSFRPAILSASQ